MDALSAFGALDVRVGTVIGADRLLGIRKAAYALIIDLGEQIGIKRSAAQITEIYTPDELVGKQVLAVANLPPKNIGSFVSEVLVLGVSDVERRVVLLTPERAVPNGAKMF